MYTYSSVRYRTKNWQKPENETGLVGNIWKKKRHYGPKKDVKVCFQWYQNSKASYYVFMDHSVAYSWNSGVLVEHYQK